MRDGYEDDLSQVGYACSVWVWHELGSWNQSFNQFCVLSVNAKIDIDLYIDIDWRRALQMDLLTYLSYGVIYILISLTV